MARSLRAAAKLDAAGAAAAAFSNGERRGVVGLRECGADATEGGRGGTGEKEEEDLALAPGAPIPK